MNCNLRECYIEQPHMHVNNSTYVLSQMKLVSKREQELEKELLLIKRLLEIAEEGLRKWDLEDLNKAGVSVGITKARTILLQIEEERNK